MHPHLRWQRFYTTVLAGLAVALVTVHLCAAPLPQGDETAAAGEAEPPRIVFGSVTYDAGLVERGEMITHEFTFRNTGGSDLVILSTKAG